VKLTIEAPTLHGPWLMRVTNAGEVPLRFVADARLLSLEMTPRSVAKSLKCTLPGDMRPNDDMERPLVLPPGRSYVEPFDPRLYCLSGKQADALAQGTSLVAHLGWTGGNRARPPYVVGPIDGVEPVVSALKSIDSAPIMLPDDPTPPRLPPSAAVSDDPDPPRLTLRGQPSVDTSSPNGIMMDVTLRNSGKRPVTLRFRPESLSFTVEHSAGVDECRWPTPPVAAMRELYSTLPPGGSATQSVQLMAYCNGHALDAPGLLLITPHLDTRKASGDSLGLRTFDGEVHATRPTVVRLRQGLKPVQLVRPHLEGAQ
jgi:hypothetical protein